MALLAGGRVASRRVASRDPFSTYGVGSIRTHVLIVISVLHCSWFGRECEQHGEQQSGGGGRGELELSDAAQSARQQQLERRDRRTPEGSSQRRAAAAFRCLDHFTSLHSTRVEVFSCSCIRIHIRVSRALCECHLGALEWRRRAALGTALHLSSFVVVAVVILYL